MPTISRTISSSTSSTISTKKRCQQGAGDLSRLPRRNLHGVSDTWGGWPRGLGRHGGEARLGVGLTRRLLLLLLHVVFLLHGLHASHGPTWSAPHQGAVPGGLNSTSKRTSAATGVEQPSHLATKRNSSRGQRSHQYQQQPQHSKNCCANWPASTLKQEAALRSQSFSRQAWSLAHRCLQRQPA